MPLSPARHAANPRPAAAERAALCDLLLELGPTAPTLCEGWNSADLAAHLWTREHDPLSMPGVALAPLAELTSRRMDRALDRLGFEGLVAELRRPAPIFRVPAIDDAVNTLEYLVHHEDLRRGADPVGARPLHRSDELEQAVWRQLPMMGRALFRGSPIGVIAERTDAAGRGERARLHRAQSGSVIIRGTPSEIVLFTFGRRSAAEVEVAGAADAVEAFLAEVGER